MSQRQINQWRTVGVAVFACLLLLGAYVVSVWRAGVPLDLAKVDRLFDSLTDAVVWLIAAVALKAGVQHLAGGGGLKGAKAALLTEAKPEDPPPEAKP